MGVREERKGTLSPVCAMTIGLVAVVASPDRGSGSDLKGFAPGDVIDGLQSCRTETDEGKRLQCYDTLARENAPPRYAGKLGYRTSPFTLDHPHLLRYRSQGVIFVLYLLDEHGRVLQNLHLGGGGEDSFLIEEPGTYSLQIDGSARWQIWLDPA